jgi:hypothetical protein
MHRHVSESGRDEPETHGHQPHEHVDLRPRLLYLERVAQAELYHRVLLRDGTLHGFHDAASPQSFPIARSRSASARSRSSLRWR